MVGPHMQYTTVQAAVDAAALLATADAHQVVMVSPGVLNQYTPADYVDVVWVQQTQPSFESRYSKAPIHVPYPAAVCLRVDDPSGKNTAIAEYNKDWWFATSTDLPDPLKGGANNNPIDYAHRRGIVFSFAVVSDHTNGTLTSITWLTSKQLQLMVWAGHEIGSHSKTHTNPATAAAELTEIVDSRTALEAALAATGASLADANTLRAAADVVSTLVIPGAFSRANDMLDWPDYYNERMDRLMRDNYDLVQCYGSINTVGAEYARYYESWNCLVPGATWNGLVEALAERAKTPGLKTTIAWHGPAGVSAGYSPSTVEWKLLIDEIYAGILAGKFCCVPMRALPDVVLSDENYYAGGMVDGQFTSDFSIANRMDSALGGTFGQLLTLGANADAVITANSAFWNPNTLHTYAQGGVMSITATTGDPLVTADKGKIQWTRIVQPGSRYILSFDLVAPATTKGVTALCSITHINRPTQPDESPAEGTAAYTVIRSEYHYCAAGNDWGAYHLPIFTHPDCRCLIIDMKFESTSTGVVVSDTIGFSLANVQLVKVG
jgi:hypothetical protein